MKVNIGKFFEYEIPKNYSNLICISDHIDIKKPVYKYMSFEDAYFTIFNKFMYFSNVAKWTDKFENPLRYVENVKNIPSLEVPKELNSNSTFGSCWTLNFDSDAMWSSNNKKICIKTTIERLLCSMNLKSFWFPCEFKYMIEDSFINSCGLNYYIGKVRYLNAKYIANGLCDLKSTDYPYGYASFYLKRREFQHENEIRILIANNFLLNDRKIKKNNLNFAPNIFIPLNDNNYIDCLYLHPGLNEQQEDIYKKMFSEFILPKKIKKSTLYDAPYGKVKVNKNNMIYKKNEQWCYCVGHSKTWNIEDKRLYKRGEEKSQLLGPEPSDLIKKV